MKLAFKAETTDKLIVLSDDGKVYTLGADKLPGGRSMGEPIRLMVDVDDVRTSATSSSTSPTASC